MFMVKINPDTKHHWLLGNIIGEGKEHIVFAKNNKWVYKIYCKYSFSPKLVYEYIKSRNSVPRQLPCKFVGLAYIEKRWYPIFKQRRVTSVEDNDEFYSIVKHIYMKYGYDETFLKNNIRLLDIIPSNFGKLNGVIYAIDIQQQPIQ